MTSRTCAMRAARTAVFLPLLFVALSSACAAQDSGLLHNARGRTYDPSKPLSSPTFTFQKSSGQPLDFSTRAQSAPRRFALPHKFKAHSRQDPVSPEDNVCYFVRSYLVARESRDSDVTLPVGYRTCTSSSKFGVKRAALPPR